MKIYLKMTQDRRPDITRLKKYLDYAEFSVPLEEGLKYTIEYFKNELTKCQKVFRQIKYNI